MISESTRQLRVADVMTAQVLTVSASTPVGAVLEVMEDKHVNALPILDDRKVRWNCHRD